MVPILGWIVFAAGLVLAVLAVLLSFGDPQGRSPLVTMRWPILIGTALAIAGLWLALAGPAAAAGAGEASHSAFAWRPLAAASPTYTH